MFFKRLQFFLFISFFVLKRCLQYIMKLSVWNIVVKLNAGCNEFESNKVAILQNVSRAEENKTRKVKKTK